MKRQSEGRSWKLETLYLLVMVDSTVAKVFEKAQILIFVSDNNDVFLEKYVYS